jgi:hypothetical protein
LENDLVLGADDMEVTNPTAGPTFDISFDPLGQLLLILAAIKPLRVHSGSLHHHALSPG